MKSNSRLKIHNPKCYVLILIYIHENMTIEEASAMIDTVRVLEVHKTISSKRSSLLLNT